MNVKIDGAGRIVVPKGIRERFGLRPGTDLEIVESREGIILRRLGDSPRLVREGLLLVHRGVTAGSEATRWVEDEREDRIREIWSR